MHTVSTNDEAKRGVSYISSQHLNGLATLQVGKVASYFSV